MSQPNELASVEGQLVGMPLAGPESFSAEQLAYLKRALGVDETVLWEGTSAMSDNPTITLSEAATNFKFVDIYTLPHSTNGIPLVVRIYSSNMGSYTNKNGSFTVIGHAGGGGFRINNCLLEFTTGYTVLQFREQKQSSIVGTAVSTTNAANSIIKIVGIGRKENA